MITAFFVSISVLMLLVAGAYMVKYNETPVEGPKYRLRRFDFGLLLFILGWFVGVDALFWGCFNDIIVGWFMLFVFTLIAGLGSVMTAKS